MSKAIVSGILIGILVPIALIGTINIDRFTSAQSQANVSFGTPVDLSDDTYQAHYPWVSTSGSNVYVAWTEEAHGIYIRTSSNNGLNWSPAMPAAATRLSPKGGTTSYPVMAVNGSNVYVVWTQSLTSGGNSEIFVATSNNYGVSFNTTASTTDLTSTMTSYTSDIPYIAAYGNDAYVIWHSIATSSSAQSVWVSSSTNSGQTWSAPTELDAKSGQADEPQIAAWGNYVYATWDRNGAWFAYSSNNGATWSTPVNLNPGSKSVPAGLVREPWITASGSNVYVTWNDDSGYGTTLGTVYDPYIMVSNNNGLTWNQNYSPKGVKLNLMPTSTSSWEIQAQAVGNSVYVIWRDHTPAYTTNGDILMMMSTNAGLTWTPALGTTPMDVSDDNQITGWSNGIGVSGSTVAIAYMSDCVTGLQEPSPNSGSGDCGMMVSYSNNGGQSFYPEVNVSNDRTAGPITDVSSSNFAVSGSNVYVTWQDEPQTTFQVYFSSTDGTVQQAPSMSITPVKGAVGTSVTVSGTNYDALSTIAIKLDGSTIATTTSNSGGSFSTSIVIPQTIAGSNNITATDGTNTLSKSFNVVSKITLSPVKGSTGKAVTVTGTGFAPASSVLVTYDSANIVSTDTNSSGSFTTTITVPSSVDGKHTITATDGSMNSDSATYTVVPSISEKPVSAKQGASITATVNGNGFAANSQVTVTFGGVQVATIATNSTGSFTTSYTVPTSDAPAKYTVQATDSSSDSATATFTINA